MENLIELVESYGSLEYNWNKNGANPLDKKLINKTKDIIKKLIKRPEVFVTARNSIQLEFHNSNGEYLEFEILEDKIEMFSDRDKEETVLEESKLNTILLNFYSKNLME